MNSAIHRSWSILLQTVPGASRSLFLSILLTIPSQAIIDTNSNGVSDLWEKTYNSGTLYTNFDPQADTDGDGWTNATEAISGTDPGNAYTPTGILRPEILQTPAVYINGPTGDPEIFTPAAVSITWPTLAGKQYTLFASVDLTAGSWLAIDNDTPRIGTTAPMGNAFPITQPDGSTPPAMFYRLAINDADSDGDTLTNHEEAQQNTDPFSIDTDRDGFPDNTDPAPLSSATLTDPDGAGLVNAQNIPLSIASGIIGRWNLEDHQIVSNPPTGYTPFQYPDSAGTNPATSHSVFPNPEGMVSKATNHAGGYVSIPNSVLGVRKVYTVAFWALLETGSIAAANGTPVALFGHHYREPWVSGGLPQAGRYTERFNGIWFERTVVNNVVQERLRAGTRETYNHLNGQPTALQTLNRGIDILRPLGTADDGKWHHYTFVHDDAIKTLYIDGVRLGNPTSAGSAIIPINTVYSGISLGRYGGPSPAATGYFWGTSPTRGRFDRLRLWSTPLTQGDATALYREDIDKDGLWDITENNRLWRDNNSDTLQTPAERTFSSSPFIWQPTTSDTDDDGLIDIQEQDLGTKIDNPDTDGDLLPDGWEVDCQLDPLIANNANDDTDLDGLGLLDEYRYNTNPTLANTDGDSQNDGPEVGQGSNPNDNSDGGSPIPAAEKLSVLLGIGDKSGSESEDYVLNCYRLDPQTGQEKRIYTLRSGGYGKYEEETQSIFKKGEGYTFQIDWQSSSLDYQPASPGVTAEGPDYDYTFKVQPQGSNNGILIDAYDPKTKTIVNPILADEASDVATTESEFRENYERLRVYTPQAELKDIKDHVNTEDDVTIVNWDTAQQIVDNNIAWIEAHSSATDAAPRMPQLELRIAGLGQGMTIEAKFEVQYDRGNGQRTARNRPEDRVRIPDNGNYQAVNGDTWRLWESYANQPFFGGEVTLTYRLMSGQNQVMAPQTLRFRIGGKNPDAARAKTHIETLNNAGPQGTLWFAYAIAKSESRDYNGNGTRYNQFWQLPRDANDTAYRATRQTNAGRPVWNNDGNNDQGVPLPGGYGLIQVTGDATSSEIDIPRVQIWNWQSNALAGLVILGSKQTIADTWMIRQKNANNANGVSLPDLAVGGVTFSENTNRTMNNAVTMKAWNGARPIRTGHTDNEGPALGFIIDPVNGGHFCYWRNNVSPNGWALSRYNRPADLNINPFNYVQRVCNEVE